MDSNKEKSKLNIWIDIYLDNAQKFVSNNQYDEAIENMKKALDAFKELEDIHGYITNLNLLGIIYSKAKDDKKSFECYLEAMALAEIHKDDQLKALCCTNVGGCYLKMGKHKIAFEYFREAQKVLEDPRIRAEYPVLSLINYVNLIDSYEYDAENKKLFDIGNINIYNDKALVFV